VIIVILIYLIVMASRRATGANRNAQMKLPESKLPKDKKLTADNMISGAELE
jgi:hypothetical protein